MENTVAVSLNLNLDIRRAGFKDVRTMAEFLAALFKIETDFKVDIRKHEYGLFKMIRDYPQRIIFVAVMNRELVGMITGQIVISTASGCKSILVEDVFVKEEFRRQGIGKKLLETMKEWAASNGALRMQLVVDTPNNQAIDFYKKHGWTQSQMQAMYYYF
jgi:GNAT superfamily N-acetyltransferase